MLSMMESDSMAVQNFIPGVHSVSTIRAICEISSISAISIDPPDHMANCLNLSTETLRYVGCLTELVQAGCSLVD